MKYSRTLTIAPTNKCPLACEHCGPESGPHQSGQLKLESILNLVESLSHTDFKVINLSGGEPFLVKGILPEIVNSITKKNINSRITTSGYWARDEQIAKEILEPIAIQGLSELFLSTSDAHITYTNLEVIINAVKAARTFGVTPIIGVLKFRGCEVTLNNISKQFRSRSLATPIIYEQPVIPYGRARNSFSGEELILKEDESLRGPCPSITKNPALLEDGSVTGCSVVFGRSCKPLHFGNINHEPFDVILNRLENNPLANLIHSIGVVALKELVEDNTDMRFSKKHVNICHLCGEILSNKKAIDYLTKEKIINQNYGSFGLI